MVLVVLYMPIWFQAIKGVDAEQSGIRSIPLVLGLVCFVILSGIGVQRIGYYTPFMYAGSIVMPIGAGMLTTLTVSSGHSEWIGYQVLIGMGMGMGMQQPNIGAQTVLPRKDTSVGVALLFLCQSLGGTIFASAAQNILDSHLISNLQAANLPISPAEIVNAGATNLRGLVSAKDLPILLVAYNDAITKGALLISVVTASLVVLGAVVIPWRSTKKGKGHGKAAPSNEIPDVPQETETAKKEEQEEFERPAEV